MLPSRFKVIDYQPTFRQMPFQLRFGDRAVQSMPGHNQDAFEFRKALGESEGLSAGQLLDFLGGVVRVVYLYLYTALHKSLRDS